MVNKNVHTQGSASLEDLHAQDAGAAAVAAPAAAAQDNGFADPALTDVAILRERAAFGEAAGGFGAAKASNAEVASVGASNAEVASVGAANAEVASAEEASATAATAEPAAAATAASAAEAPAPRELTFDQKLDALGTAVTRHPLNKECLYRALVFCLDEQPLRAVEDAIAALPAFQSATQNQFHMICTLQGAYGLELIERDEQGARVTPQQKEGLTEDEVDDLVFSLNYRTTEVGRAFVELFAPHSRLVDLMNLAPERTDTYRELLAYVRDSPRSYDDIKALLAGKPALETVIAGHREVMQASVFVDKLERAGALVWDKGWRLTEEGEGFLEELQAGI